MEFILQTATGMWEVVGRMAPYLLLGFLMAGILSQAISHAWITRHLGGNRFTSVVKAAFFGVPLPICSCGVIPLAATLRRQGASKGATMGFLIATPQTGADSISVNYALLGPVFAVVTPVCAFVGGLIGGFLVDATRPRGEADADSVAGMGDKELAACCDSKAVLPEPAPAACCASSRTPKPVSNSLLALYTRTLGALEHGFVTMPRDIARPIIVGLLVAALMGTLLPDDFFANVLGSGLGAMLLVMLAALPMYACSTGSIPIAAMLIAKGVAPGVALVFLLAGPAINAATMTTVYKTLGLRCAAIHVATIGVVAIVAGHIVNAIFAATPAHIHQHFHEEGVAWYGHLAGVLLALILGYAVVTQLAAKWGKPHGKEAAA
jgi:uncharacterized membrane protein YraQ (UPF0718 family)